MAKAKSVRTPKYRRQKRPKSPDEAIVELSGKRHYLGEYGSPESLQAYHQLLAEWTINHRTAVVEPNGVTIVELIATFWRHVESYYVKSDGTPTSEVANFRLALWPLKELYGNTRAADFGPRALQSGSAAISRTGERCAAAVLSPVVLLQPGRRC